jgi:predicted SnoaL-like aldol condensation-catalyzing enzyme
VRAPKNSNSLPPSTLPLLRRRRRHSVIARIGALPVLRDGKDGVLEGLKAMFAQFPENRAEIITGYELGPFVVLHEKVWRTAAGEPFEVMSIYSFAGDKVERVEFVR